MEWNESLNGMEWWMNEWNEWNGIEWNGMESWLMESNNDRMVDEWMNEWNEWM